MSIECSSFRPCWLRVVPSSAALRSSAAACPEASSRSSHACAALTIHAYSSARRSFSSTSTSPLAASLQLQSRLSSQWRTRLPVRKRTSRATSHHAPLPPTRSPQPSIASCQITRRQQGDPISPPLMAWQRITLRMHPRKRMHAHTSSHLCWFTSGQRAHSHRSSSRGLNPGDAQVPLAHLFIDTYSIIPTRQRPTGTDCAYNSYQDGTVFRGSSSHSGSCAM